jgi:uncharacterized protein
LSTEQATASTLCPDLARVDRHEQTAVAAFVQRLNDRFGADLYHVALFGSRARGDARKESDFDFLVVLRLGPGEYWTQWRIVADLAWEVELSYGITISVVVKSVDGWAVMLRRQPLLAREIRRDGVVLWTSRHDGPTLASA